MDHDIDFKAEQPALKKPDGRKSRRFWTAREDSILERGFTAKTYAEMAELLPGRSKNSVRDRLRTLGMLP